MPWKPALNSGLGLLPVNPAAPDTIPFAFAGTFTPVGTIAQFIEDSTGATGEFIYLPGVASLAAGDAVVYDLLPTGATVTRLANNAQNNTGRPVAVALSNPNASQYGWFQIGGVATVNTVASTVAGVAMASSTTGSLSNTADAGDQILGARISSAVGTPAANQSYITLNRPHIQGQIT
jgi:hypothetical protein